MSQPIPSKPHEHQFSYYAAVNLFRGTEAVGVVDFWRCSICHVKATELRVQGLENLSAEAGFPVLDSAETRWVLFVCRAEEQPKFDLFNLHVGEEIQHECVEKVGPIRTATDYSIENKADKYHRIYNLDNYLNDALELIPAPEQKID
ncbi:MAG: hypothetical protein ACYCPW_12750 [Nitrososphaerales archaeon]